MLDMHAGHSINGLASHSGNFSRIYCLGLLKIIVCSAATYNPKQNPDIDIKRKRCSIFYYGANRPALDPNAVSYAASHAV